MSFNEVFNELFGLRVVLQDLHSDERIIIKRLKQHLRDNTLTSADNIDKTIIDFYKYYGIDFSEEFISSIQILPSYNPTNIASILLNGNLQNILEEEVEDSDDELLEEVDNSEENTTEENIDLSNNTEVNTDQSNNTINNYNITHTINFQNMNFNNPEQLFSIINSHAGTSTFNIPALGQVVFTPNPSMEDVKVTLEEDDLQNIVEEEITEDLKTKCSICMMNFSKGNKLCKLKCGHSFHKDCIMQWLSEYNYRCPVCRTECGKAKYHV